MKTSFSSLFLGIAVMISGFSAVAEAWVTPDQNLGRNVSEILPHSIPFLNGQSDSLDFPSAIYRGAPTTQPPSGQDCSAVVVTLKNEVLDNGYGFLQGTYLRSTGVNGKLSWINGDYAIWFTPNNWIIGDLSSIGSSNAYIYANIDTTDVTADEIQWNYWTGNVWKLAPNEISVTCNDAKECECLSEITELKTSIFELLNSKFDLINSKFDWIGSWIEAQDDCRDNPCQNGQCIDLENDYRCDCNPGYSGKNCDNTCPLDNPLFREVDGVCLSFNPDLRNYADARELCENAEMNGFTTGRLFEPHTKYFNDKVYDEAIDVFGGKKSAWIGINAKGGPWVYTNSGTELEFENWNPGQPNDEAQDCVLSDSQNGKWWDYPCNNKLFFICEFV